MDDAPSAARELRFNRLHDWVMAAFAPLAAGEWWHLGSGEAWRVTPADFDGIRGGWVGKLILGVGGPPLWVLFLTVFSVWISCVACGAVWRLMRRAPVIRASVEGLTFHPSIGPGFVGWAEVRSVRWNGGSPGEMEVRLMRRFRSTWNWMATDRVRFNVLALGLSWREARALVAALRRMDVIGDRDSGAAGRG